MDTQKISIEANYRKAMEAEPCVCASCGGLGFIEVQHEFSVERIPCQECSAV